MQLKISRVILRRKNLLLFYSIFALTKPFLSEAALVEDLSKLKKNLEQSDSGVIYQLEIEGYNKEINSSLLESPWALAFNLNDENFSDDQENSNATFSRLKNNYEASSTLTFEKNNSFKTDFTIDYTKNIYQRQTALTTDTSTNTYGATLQFQYNIFKGGNSSLSSINARYEKTNNEINKIQKTQERNQFFLSIAKDTLNYFALMCKNEITKISHEKINSIIIKAEKLKDLNLISTKDFLTYQGLQLTILEEKIQFEQSLLQIEDILKSYGEIFYKEILKLKINSCEKKIYNAVNKKNTTPLDRNPQNLLAINLADKLSQLKRTNLSQEIQKTKSNLFPYLKFSSEKPEEKNYQNYSVEVGINWNWDLPSNKETYSNNGKRNALEAQIKNAETARRRTPVIVTNYAREIESLYKKLEIYLENLKSTDALINIMNIESKIGKSDSLSFTNAFQKRQNYINFILDTMTEIDINLLNIDYAYAD